MLSQLFQFQSSQYLLVPFSLFFLLYFLGPLISVCFIIICTSLPLSSLNLDRLSSRITNALLHTASNEHLHNFMPWLKARPAHIRFQVSNIHKPSLSTTILPVLPLALVFFLFQVLGSLPSKEATSRSLEAPVQNTLVALAGMGTILFALFILVAETLRDEASNDRSRVLLKESYLYPITVIAISSLIFICWTNSTLFLFIMAAILAILTLYSLARILQLLLSPVEFSKRRLDYLDKQVRASISLGVIERVGTNIFLAAIKNEMSPLTYSMLPLREEERSARHSFYPERTGKVTDVNISLLREFVTFLESESHAAGHSLYKDKPIPSNSTPGDATGISSSEISTYKQAKTPIIHVRYLNDIIDLSKPLISIDRKCLPDKHTQFKLESMVKRAFRIEKCKDYQEELLLILDGLKQQFCIAIDMQDFGAMDSYTKAYLRIAESFLAGLQDNDAQYSYEQAKEEASSIIDGWKEIGWLSETLEELLRRAIRTKEIRVISSVAYLAMGICRRSVELGDYYTFLEFIRFQTLLYSYVTDESSGKLKHQMFDLTWRYLRELSEYTISYKLLSERHDTDSIDRFGKYSESLLLTMNVLLRLAAKAGEQEHFSVLVAKLSEVCSIDDWRYGESLDLLATRLAVADGTEGAEQLREELATAQMLQGVVKQLELLRNTIVFGISALLLNDIWKEDADEDLVKLFRTATTYLPQNLSEITRVFLYARRMECERKLGWLFWDEHPERIAVSFNLLGRLDRLYVLWAMRLLSRQKATTDFRLPVSREFSTIIGREEKSDGLFSVIRDVAAHVATRLGSDKDVTEDTVGVLKVLLTRAREEQDKAELEIVKSAPLDVERVNAFVHDVRSSYRDSATIKALFEAYGTYRRLDDSISPRNLSSWGFNQIESKEPLVADPQTHYLGFGESFGRGLASGETERFFEWIIDRSNQVYGATVNGWQSILQLAYEGFGKSRSAKDLLIITDANFFRKADKLVTPFYSKDCPQTPVTNIAGYVGTAVLQGVHVPIVRIYRKKKENTKWIFLVDMKKFCEYVEYGPITDSQERDYVQEGLYVRVWDLNEDELKRQEILNGNPPWLEEHEDPDDHLRKCILLKVLRKFEFELRDRSACCGLEISDDNENKGD